MILAFVGIDGAGKTSIIERIKEYLISKNYRVLVFKTLNGNSDFSKLLSDVKNDCIQRERISMKELNQIIANFMAIEIYRDSIKLDELKEEYDFILLDRWTCCQEIYDKVWFVWNDFIKCCLDKCIVPDMTFLVTADMKNIEKRLSMRNTIKASENFFALRRAKKMYEKYAADNKWTVIINDKCVSDSIDAVIKVLRGNV